MLICLTMEAWLIAVIVVSVIGGFYILLISMGLLFVLVFSHIFRKHNTALGMMIHSKYENVKKLIDVLNRQGIHVPFKCINYINEINTKSFYNQEDPDCVKARNNLSLVTQEIAYIISTSGDISKNLELQRAKESIHELDQHYRTLIAMYNADALGYNYWINFLPGKYFKYIFRWKEKQII